MHQSTMLKDPSLVMGKIVRAWWPEFPNVAPGPKFRPVLFLGETRIEGVSHWVVAYGTTQCQEEKESRNGGDLFVSGGECNSSFMQCDGKFDFNKVKALPATSEYFGVNQSATYVKSTDLPQKYFQQAAECMRRANVAKKLCSLGVTL